MNPFCSQQAVSGKPHGPHTGLRLAKAFSSLGRNPLLPVPRGAIPALGLCVFSSHCGEGRRETCTVADQSVELASTPTLPLANGGTWPETLPL